MRTHFVSGAVQWTTIDLLQGQNNFRSDTKGGFHSDGEESIIYEGSTIYP